MAIHLRRERGEGPDFRLEILDGCSSLVDRLSSKCQHSRCEQNLKKIARTVQSFKTAFINLSAEIPPTIAHDQHLSTSGPIFTEEKDIPEANSVNIL